MKLPRPIKRRVRALLGRFVTLQEPLELVDISPGEWQVIAAVKPYTMTTPPRVVGLLRAVDYLVKAGIPGAMVECGVYKGGSMLAVAMKLRELGVSDRELWLYDTFEGMVAPGAADLDWQGKPAMQDYQAHQAEDGSSQWARAGVEEVRNNLAASGYPGERTRYVIGKVEDTIPKTLPGQIALLRLDTDWYESTKHELEHLYPLLAPGGVLIIDDYGHYQGCRQAVDEYLAKLDHPLLLQRMDYSGRLAVKPFRPPAGGS
ncbi:MAG TPA: TylF/MycF/NovP-related O-methyltransferase [Solimonas sp.]|nr:TylF/MycF/NovP-related O-methyltransferase [Solimonas sp.]